MVLTFFWSLFGELGAHLVGRMAMTAFGVLWIAVGFAYVLLLRDLEHGMALTILVMACTMLSDTFAYFVGRAIGRHRMAPRISPKKSVEGAVGGLVGAVVAALDREDLLALAADQGRDHPGARSSAWSGSGATCSSRPSSGTSG